MYVDKNVIKWVETKKNEQTMKNSDKKEHFTFSQVKELMGVHRDTYHKKKGRWR